MSLLKHIQVLSWLLLLSTIAFTQCTTDTEAIIISKQMNASAELQFQEGRNMAAYGIKNKVDNAAEGRDYENDQYEFSNIQAYDIKLKFIPPGQLSDSVHFRLFLSNPITGNERLMGDYHGAYHPSGQYSLSSSLFNFNKLLTGIEQYNLRLEMLDGVKYEQDLAVKASFTLLVEGYGFRE